MPVSAASQTTSSRRILWMVFTCACALLFFTYGSGTLPLLGPDEPRYSQVARQMMDSGSYVIPRLGGSAWFEKPVLLYWLMCGAFSVLGISEFAARLPSAVAALVCMLAVCWAVGRVAGHKRGALSGLILASSAFVVGFSHAATFDMLLTLCTTCALLLFFLQEEGYGGPRYLYGMYAMTGLAVLAKGFVGLILIGLPITSYLLLQRRPARLIHLKPIPGLLIFLAVAAIWYLPITWLYGIRFWDEFFYQHHFIRYTSSQYHRSGGLLFYIPIALAGTYPWTAAPLLGSHTGSSLRRFCWTWFLSTILFFSFSRSQLPGYILPATPAFAILAALALADFSEKELPQARQILWTFAPLNLLAISALLVMAMHNSILEPALLFTAGVIAVIGCAALASALLRRWRTAVLVYACAPLLIMVFAVHRLPGLLSLNESRRLAGSVQEELTGNRKLLLYNIYDFSLVYYTNARVELTPEGYFPDITDYRRLYKYLQQKREAFVVVGNEELDWIRKADFWKVARVFPGPRRSIVHLVARPGR
jgi:4-amino-4-deoxy-L-arabinose transferase-like glycosyltransferase